MTYRRISVLILAVSLVGTCFAGEPSPALKQFFKSHCLECHNQTDKTGELALDNFFEAEIGKNGEVWEKVVRKLTARQMPPKEMPRPKEREYDEVVSLLESALDAAAARSPNPGR